MYNERVNRRLRVVTVILRAQRAALWCEGGAAVSVNGLMRADERHKVFSSDRRRGTVICRAASLCGIEWALCAKLGGTAGCKVLSLNYQRQDFLFFGGYFMFIISKRWRTFCNKLLSQEVLYI